MTTNTITALLLTVAATNWFPVENTQLEGGIVSEQSWLEVGTNRFLLSSNVVMESAPLRVRTNETLGIFFVTNAPFPGVWTNPAPYWLQMPPWPREISNLLWRSTWPETFTNKVEIRDAFGACGSLNQK